MASLAYQAAGLRIYSVAPPAHAGDWIYIRLIVPSIDESCPS